MTMTPNIHKRRGLLYGSMMNDVRDGVVTRGFLNLLSESVSGIKFDYFAMADSVVTDKKRLPRQYDFICIVGTPWIWDRCHETMKHENLRNLLELNPKAKIMFAGIGSCFYLTDGAVENATLDLSVFDKRSVIVRDETAHRVLDRAGIKSSHLLCPSYFSSGEFETNTAPNDNFLLIPIGVSSAIFSGGLSDAEKSDYWQKLKTLPATNVAYCENKEHTEVLNNFADAFKFTSIDHAVKWYRSTRKVVTSRVHCAVPAQIAGCDVELIPHDTRSQTFVPNLTRAEWELAKNLWIGSLQEFFA